MKNYSYNQHEVAEKSGGIVHSPKILQASSEVPQPQAKEWAKKLARLQEKVRELSLTLPDKIEWDLSFLSKDEKRTTIYLHERLFYTDSIDATLTYFAHSRIGMEDGLGVDTSWRLSFEFFSDKAIQADFAKFAKSHPRETRHVAETSYYFDNQGRFAKTTRLPETMKVSRKPIQDLGLAKDYISEMTKEDFILAERALTFFLSCIEDYIKWSRLPLIT